MTRVDERTVASVSDKGNTASPVLAVATALVRGAVAISGALGSLVVLSMTILVVADVTLRTFFDLPLKGASEIGAFMVTAVVFLQTPLAAYAGRLTRLEWFGARLQRTSPLAGTIHGVLTDAAGAIALLLIAKASAPRLIDAWLTAEFFGTRGHFTAPSWPVRLIIVACSLLAVIAFLLRIVTRLAAFRQRS